MMFGTLGSLPVPRSSDGYLLTIIIGDDECAPESPALDSIELGEYILV